MPNFFNVMIKIKENIALLSVFFFLFGHFLRQDEIFIYIVHVHIVCRWRF